VDVQLQSGRYHIRGALNQLPFVDEIRSTAESSETLTDAMGVIGAKIAFKPARAQVVATFENGAPAVVMGEFGKGKTIYVGACPGVTYVKDAKFVPAELKELWPAHLRHFVNLQARQSGAPRLAELSHPVVEAGVYDAEEGTALVLANFTYEPIRRLDICLPMSKSVKSVRSLTEGALRFEQEKAKPKGGNVYRVKCTVELGLNDVVLFE